MTDNPTKPGTSQPNQSSWSEPGPGAAISPPPGAVPKQSEPSGRDEDTDDLFQRATDPDLRDEQNR